MTTLPRPRAILFDWDNTLVDTWPLIHSAMNATLREMGQEEWSIAKVRAEIKHSMRDSFPVLFGDRWEEAGRVYQQSYRSMHLSALTALPGAENMLAAIDRSQVFVGVVSNKQSVTLRQEVPALGWSHYFDVLVGATDAPRDKPHGDPALLALKDSGITPSPAVWFVGDTIADLGCAQAIGATGILYGDQATQGNQLNGYPFAAHVHNQQALRELILGTSV